MATATTLRRLSAAGVDAPHRLRSVPMWRTSATSKLHNHDGCSRLQGRGRLVPTDVTAAGDDDWCSTCWSWPADGELGEWLGFATVVADLADALAAADRHPGLVELTRLGVAADAARDARSCDPALADHRRALLADAAALLGAHLKAPEMQRRATLAAAARHLAHLAEMPRSSGVPAGTDLRWAPPLVERVDHETRRSGPLVVAWRRLADRVAAGVEITEAAADARRHGAERLDEAFDANNVPETTRLDKADFEHPMEWSRAEWRLVALEELDAAVAGWCERIAERADADEWVVVDVSWPRRPDGNCESAAPLAPFDPVRMGYRALVCAPKVAYQAYKVDRPGDSILLCDRQVTRDVLELAAPLVGAEPVRKPDRVRAFAAAALLA